MPAYVGCQAISECDKGAILMVDDLAEVPTFDDMVDAIKRDLWLDRLGPYSELRVIQFGPSGRNILAAILVYVSTLPIAIGLKLLT